MYKKLITLLFFSLVTSINGQKIKKYVGDISLDKEKKSLSAHFEIELQNFKKKDSIKLFIHESSEIKSITNNHKELNYIITNEKLIGEDKAIIIPANHLQTNKIKITYKSDLNAIKNRNFKFNPDWIELNIYSAWFPFNITYGTFDYELNIKTKNKIVSTHVNGTTIKSVSKTFDIPIVISNKLDVTTTSNSKITLYHQDIDKDIISRIKASSDRFYNSYKNMFGLTKTKNLSITINNFARTIVYARPQFISLSLDGTFSNNNDKTLAHEIGHLWWNKANVGTWEDWLNEAFAEYSALLTYKKEFGIDDFKLKINKLSKRVTNIPPIWGIDKLNPKSNTVLTYKGAYILHKLEQKIGSIKMIDLLKNIHQSEIKTTSNFLNLLEEKLGKGLRVWLESELKK